VRSGCGRHVGLNLDRELRPTRRREFLTVDRPFVTCRGEATARSGSRNLTDFLDTPILILTFAAENPGLERDVGGRLAATAGDLRRPSRHEGRASLRCLQRKDVVAPDPLLFGRSARQMLFQKRHEFGIGLSGRVSRKRGVSASERTASRPEVERRPRGHDAREIESQLMAQIVDEKDTAPVRNCVLVSRFRLRNPVRAARLQPRIHARRATGRAVITHRSQLGAEDDRKRLALARTPIPSA
jgi:hypothetical protein